MLFHPDIELPISLPPGLVFSEKIGDFTAWRLLKFFDSEREPQSILPPKTSTALFLSESESAIFPIVPVLLVCDVGNLQQEQFREEGYSMVA